MASFASVSDAVTCAVSVQEAVGEHNRQSPKDEVILRIGLHAGEPIEDDGDLFACCPSRGPSREILDESRRDLGAASASVGTGCADVRMAQEQKSWASSVRTVVAVLVPERLTHSTSAWAPSPSGP